MQPGDGHHLGVINALERCGIKVDLVAGCSVGGAVYVSKQMPLLESWVRSFSYCDVIRLMDVSWHRSGLLRGERIFNHIQRLIGHDLIEQCTLPFGAVTTNLSTGRELWLIQGDIRQAVRVSCSIPGLLEPVAWNGWWMVQW